jgi:hypothetical protein
LEPWEVDSEREEGVHGVVLAGMREERDEDDPPLIFLTKRYGLLLLGSTWAATGPVVGWNGGLLGQVMSFSPFFLFCFYFLFYIFNLNSYLNSILFVNNW